MTQTLKIIVDNKTILEVTDTMKKVICNEIRETEFYEDLDRRIVYTILEKYNACFNRLKDQWDPQLAARGIEMIPTNKEKYAELVFSQPDYKSRSERERNGN